MTAVKAGLVKVDDIRFHPHNVRRDLGDLRSLAASIVRFGILQPVVVEMYGDQLRLRAGHRRVAAARIAGLARVPAVIHDEALDDDEWLLASVHENAQRRSLDAEERRRTILALRDHGCSWTGIAEAFGVGTKTVRQWSCDAATPTPRDERVDGLREHVERLTAEGRSSAQIADSLGISARQVVRVRTGNWRVNVACTSLRTFTDEWRERPDATATEVLDALTRLVDGRLRDALPPATTDLEATA